MTLDDLLRQLEAELETLRFKSFDFDDAVAIDLRPGGNRKAKGSTHRHRRLGEPQQLFHVDLPGSSPDNDQWVLRKSRVAIRFFKGSLAIATELPIKDKNIEEVWGACCLPSTRRSADRSQFG
jgi:uncharacterized protein (UPF0303 family)